MDGPLSSYHLFLLDFTVYPRSCVIVNITQPLNLMSHHSLCWKVTFLCFLLFFDMGVENLDKKHLIFKTFFTKTQRVHHIITYIHVTIFFSKTFKRECLCSCKWRYHHLLVLNLMAHFKGIFMIHLLHL